MVVLSAVLTVSEVLNAAANSRGHTKVEVVEPVLTFWKKLAIALLDNTLDDNGWVADAFSHPLKTCPFFSGKGEGFLWAKMKQKHQKLECHTSNSCNKMLCSPCH